MVEFVGDLSRRPPDIPLDNLPDALVLIDPGRRAGRSYQLCHWRFSVVHSIIVVTEMYYGMWWTGRGSEGAGGTIPRAGLQGYSTLRVNLDRGVYVYSAIREIFFRFCPNTQVCGTSFYNDEIGIYDNFS